MKYLVSFALLLISLLSCEIVQSTEFNKNNSGEISIFINMKEYASKMKKNPIDNTEELDFDKKKNKNLKNLTLVE